MTVNEFCGIVDEFYSNMLDYWRMVEKENYGTFENFCKKAVEEILEDLPNWIEEEEEE